MDYHSLHKGNTVLWTCYRHYEFCYLTVYMLSGNEACMFDLGDRF